MFFSISPVAIAWFLIGRTARPRVARYAPPGCSIIDTSPGPGRGLCPLHEGKQASRSMNRPLGCPTFNDLRSGLYLVTASRGDRVALGRGATCPRDPRATGRRLPRTDPLGCPTLPDLRPPRAVLRSTPDRKTGEPGLAPPPCHGGGQSCYRWKGETAAGRRLGRNGGGARGAHGVWSGPEGPRGRITRLHSGIGAGGARRARRGEVRPLWTEGPGRTATGEHSGARTFPHQRGRAARGIGGLKCLMLPRAVRPR